MITFAVTMVTQKEYGFTGVFFGAKPQPSAEGYLTDFAKAAMIDPEEYKLTVQAFENINMDQQITTDIYQTMQTFTVMVAANSVDCFGTDVVIGICASSGYPEHALAFFRYCLGI